MGKLHKSIIIAIYYHPEAYPPTLNAIEQLSKEFEKVYVLYQPQLSDSWKYPENVILVKNGKTRSVREQMELGVIKKGFLFLLFTYTFLNLCFKVKPSMILVYDTFPLFSYHLIRNFINFKHNIWYHNHDVIEKKQKKYSTGWYATKNEKLSFQYLNIFSLPSAERKFFFDLSTFNGVYFNIPNYPSCSFYSSFNSSHEPVNEITLIYQGSISDGHGIKEVVQYVATKNSQVKLILVGNVSNSYKKEIVDLCENLHSKHLVEILAPVNYTYLPNITNKAHIGLAIHNSLEVIYKTGGTASNKIYEYAALGLPVLYYDNGHYKKYLSTYQWAFANDLSFERLDEQINFIKENYHRLSASALNDFNRDLNFENAFKPVSAFLKGI